MDNTVQKEKYSHTVLKILAGINGFTLIELLIAMVVALVILGATYGIFVSQNKEISNQDKIVEMQQNVRAAMDMMSRDIRMAGYNPRGKAVYPFEGIPYSTAQLRIRADLNGIYTLLGPNEDIIYVYDSANYRITRELVAGGGAQPFAENITAFTFSFLDGSGSVTTVPANIRKVRLTITGRTFAPLGDGSYPTYTLSADVYARNLAF